MFMNDAADMKQMGAQMCESKSAKQQRQKEEGREEIQTDSQYAFHTIHTHIYKNDND